MPMNAQYRGPIEMPGVIPVFPLPGALLLPRGQMPLNIFEPRYLTMVDDSLRDGHRLIGMIQPDVAHAGGADKPSLYKVGCVGRITQLAESGDGRYLIELTGGGAEIFDWEVRQHIVDHATHWEDWSRIHRLAHAKGLKTPSTMLYGHIEEPRHRVDHVMRLRELQDETGGFAVFIPLRYQHDFVDSADGKIRNRASAEYFMRWIDTLRKMADEWPMWRSQKERDHVFAQFAEARKVYEKLAAEAQ